VFTGIIEEVGTVEALHTGAGGARLTVRARRVLEDTKPGDSIAVDGCCLTVVTLGKDSFSADISRETLARTTLGGLAPGAPVNLERALRPSDRLGGHIVTGHVDATARIVSLATGTEQATLVVEIPEGLEAFVAEKGSVAVDGISLTVASLRGRIFSVALIPFTIQNTSLRAKRAGSLVNLEVDILARYVARHLSTSERSSDATLLAFLEGEEV
jgi:riboflavin synthase